jgi:hypothetical protein
MKRIAQKNLRADYESRRGEFSSYSEFLNAASRESEWQRTFWDRVAAARASEEEEAAAQP